MAEKETQRRKKDVQIVEYDREYRKAKIIVIAVCMISMIVSVLVVKTGIDDAEASRQSILVADASNTLLLALANDIELNRPNEAKATIKRLHNYLFNLTPSAKYINASIAKAEELSDQSVVQYVEKRKEEGWYNRMIADGISTEFVADSITISNSNRTDCHFHAVLYGKTSTITHDKIEFRRIVTSCEMRDADRTIENPNGFQIILWKIDSESVIKVFERNNNN